MLNGVRSVQDALGDIEAALTMRRDDQKRIDTEIAQLETAATALRAIAPLPGERPAATSVRRVSRPQPTVPARLVVDAEPEAAVPDDLKGQYPEVRSRRARVLAALPLKDDIRCAELARRLDLAQAHVQADLEKLAAQGFAERVGWGRWKRAAEEVVVWSGKDSLLPPESTATAQPS